MRYLKIYFVQCKLSIMSAAMYRANFWLMIVQSVVNSLMGILFIEFIYGSVDSVAGWNRREMIILICTSQIVNQIYRGAIHWNQNRFISSVGDGSFDRALLRPMSVAYQVNTGSVDFTCPISAIFPLTVICVQAAALGISADWLNVALYILYIVNGVAVLSSFMLLVYTSAFVFIKVAGLNNMYYWMMDIADRPKEMFSREFMYGFIFLIPALPLANAPASILLGKADLPMALAYLGAGILFPIASYAALRAGLRKYSSASA